jgi:hypothetical protein
VEDVVETSAFRQCEAIGHLLDALDNVEWPRIVRAELPFCPRLQGLSRAMQEAQPDPIPNGKLQLTMTTIVVVLGIVASLKEPFPNVGDEGVAVPE